MSPPAGAPDFGNWIRLRAVAGFVAGGAALVLPAFLPGPGLVRVLLAGAGLFLLGLGIFLGYLYYQFADAGGGVQRALWHQTLDALHWSGEGRALDVGTGNGALAILLAQRYPSAVVTGVDRWGAAWEYSRARCQDNAARCGVEARTRFVPASAAVLPFDDASFDAVVSHFVFHEVTGVEDTLDVLVEALRVLRPGGAFAFHDMFYDPRWYGAEEELRARLLALGTAEIELVDSRRGMSVAHALRSRRVLGRCGIVRGRK